MVDWLVQMRRLPAGRTLDRLIAAGKITKLQVDALADVLAHFYTEAERGHQPADEYVVQLRFYDR